MKEFLHDTPMLLSGFEVKWYAQAYNEQGQVICVRHASTKAAARAEVKKTMMPWAIRGLLCCHCNRALGMLERWFDAARHPENVLPSLEYLRARLTKPLDIAVLLK